MTNDVAVNAATAASANALLINAVFDTTPNGLVERDHLPRSGSCCCALLSRVPPICLRQRTAGGCRTKDDPRPPVAEEVQEVLDGHGLARLVIDLVELRHAVGMKLVPRLVVDLLPEGLWVNLHELSGGEWHFCCGPRDGGRSARTVEWRGHEVASGRPRLGSASDR